MARGRPQKIGKSRSCVSAISILGGNVTLLRVEEPHRYLTNIAGVNYSHRPRSGLPGPHLLRWELPVSGSERAETVSTVVPDSAGDVPLQAVRSVPLLPNGHSTAATDARFLSRLNTGRSGVSVLLYRSNAAVVRLSCIVKVTKDGGVSPPYLLPSVAP